MFSLDWDLVIVDEAHEGTTTALGDDVIKNLVKEGNGYDTKFLALSGTPGGGAARPRGVAMTTGRRRSAEVERTDLVLREDV